jgi:CubicO group peptidase (beta-lactamase class C family)
MTMLALVFAAAANGTLLSGPPGQYWFYNNWDFNALGTIVQQSAGMPLGELFAQRIAAPLRRVFGAPRVEDEDVAKLLASIVAAHPASGTHALRDAVPGEGPGDVLADER